MPSTILAKSSVIVVFQGPKAVKKPLGKFSQGRFFLEFLHFAEDLWNVSFQKNIPAGVSSLSKLQFCKNLQKISICHGCFLVHFSKFWKCLFRRTPFRSCFRGSLFPEYYAQCYCYVFTFTQISFKPLNFFSGFSHISHDSNDVHCQLALVIRDQHSFLLVLTFSLLKFTVIMGDVNKYTFLKMEVHMKQRFIGHWPRTKACIVELRTWTLKYVVESI